MGRLCSLDRNTENTGVKLLFEIDYNLFCNQDLDGQFSSAYGEASIILSGDGTKT